MTKLARFSFPASSRNRGVALAVSVFGFQRALQIAGMLITFPLWGRSYGVTGILLATPASWLIILWPAFFWGLRRLWKAGTHGVS